MSNGFNNQAEDEDTSLKGRRFQGVVIDNKDPTFKQRVRVSIPNLLEGKSSDLPWIGPSVQSSFGVTDTAVTVGVPAIGSIVTVTFQDGDLNFGMYDSSLHTARMPTPSEFVTNYPDRRGWLDPAGNLCYIDVTDGQVVFYLKHKSGTTFTVSDGGAVTVTAVQDIRATAPRIFLN